MAFNNAGLGYGHAMAYQLGGLYDIPISLKDLNVKKEDFELMASLALEDGNTITSPIQGNKEDIIRLFEEAYQ